MTRRISVYIDKFFNLAPHERVPVLLAALYFFCVLTALMVLRPAREALGMQRGIEDLRWLFYGTALITLLVNPVFGWLVSRLRRMAFISATYGFFLLSLLVFYGLLIVAPQAVGERSGQVFYVWFSVFNLFSTMVFWAVMADSFTLEQGKRFFALIAVGGTLGAVAGPLLASQLAQPFGTPILLLVAVVFLALAVLSAWWLTRVRGKAEASYLQLGERVIGGSAWAGLRSVFHSPYLLGIAAYVIILAVMATFIYFTRLQMVAALGEDVDMRTAIFARIDLATQLATLLLQAVVAGRIMKRFGVAITLTLLPITVALGFIGLAMVASLVVLVIFEACFRAVQRAITRPARETLYTVINREDKYKAKAFIDTFVYRTGDIVGAQTEGALGRTSLGLYALASVAVPLALIWAMLGLWLGRRQQRLEEQD